MAECQVPWGDQKLTLLLPAHWTLQQVAAPAVRPAPSDWPDLLADALNKAEGSPSLAKLLGGLPHGGRIILVLEDVTRSSPLTEILPILHREIRHAGIDDEQVEVIFATGMHPPMSPEQASEKIGPFADSFAWRCNDCRSPGHYEDLGVVTCASEDSQVPLLVDRGVLSADLRIVVSAVTPHLQAGFGGGAKMFAPGCAALETIAAVHSAGLGVRNRQLVGSDASTNPMRQLIDEAGRRILAAAAGPTFAVQFVLDEAHRPSTIVAGDLSRGQQMLAKQCAALAGVVVSSPADILITNAAPRDFDLWQSFKCVPNTCWAVRENGVIIVLARCPGGLNMPAPKLRLSQRWLRRIIRLLGARGIVSLFNRFAGGASGEARFFVQLAVETIYRTAVLMYSPALAETGEGFPGLEFSDSLDEVFARADAMLGAGGRRVVVFTAGGESFPVLP